jgi:hypothetical protein
MLNKSTSRKIRFLVCVGLVQSIIPGQPVRLKIKTELVTLLKRYCGPKRLASYHGSR